MPLYTLRTTQKINAPIEEVWDFISSPGNLAIITPKKMGFDITTPALPGKIYPGMIISYRVAPLGGIKLRWVTEITHVSELNYFVDEQRVGPYSLWHHEHHLEPVEGGILMTDIITYKPPLGFLGTIANRLFINRQLDNIFKYREGAIENIFGKNE